MLSYPAFLVIMAIGVIIMISMVAVPAMSKLFTSLGTELPLVTQILVSFANFITAYKIHIVLVIVAVVIIAVILKKQPIVKKLIDILALKLPIIKDIVVMRNVSRYCRSSAMLIEAGMTLPQALMAIIGTVDNDVIRQRLTEVRKNIIRGKGLSPAHAAGRLFPTAVGGYGGHR
jgi:type II secretory pathway component PulF